jgi:hypothetical protein
MSRHVKLNAEPVSQVVKYDVLQGTRIPTWVTQQ